MKHKLAFVQNIFGMVEHPLLGCEQFERAFETITRGNCIDDNWQEYNII